MCIRDRQKLDLPRADGANITYNDDGTITLGEGYAELEFTDVYKRQVPVGAVVTRNGEIVSVGRNRREKDKNALAHAEIEAIDLSLIHI